MRSNGDLTDKKRKRIARAPSTPRPTRIKTSKFNAPKAAPSNAPKGRGRKDFF